MIMPTRPLFTLALHHIITPQDRAQFVVMLDQAEQRAITAIG